MWSLLTLSFLNSRILTMIQQRSGEKITSNSFVTAERLQAYRGSRITVSTFHTHRKFFLCQIKASLITSTGECLSDACQRETTRCLCLRRRTHIVACLVSAACGTRALIGILGSIRTALVPYKNTTVVPVKSEITYIS